MLGRVQSAYRCTPSTQTDYHTANPFDILADRSPSPDESNHVFDFIPTTLGKARRRVRRGGQRHKAKRSSQKQRDEGKGDSVEEIRKRRSSLHLGDEAPMQEVDKTRENHGATVTTPSAAFLPESVSHPWKPQFRPNALPAPATPSVWKPEPAVQHVPVQLPERASPSSPPSTKTTQQDQSHILPNFLSFASLEPKGGDAPSTTVPITHGTIRPHSHARQLFVYFPPKDTIEEKAITTQKALLLQILHSTRLLPTRSLNTQETVPTFTMPYADRSTQCNCEAPAGWASPAQQHTPRAMPEA
jgi:hypothetical protein